ncbi:hypothetical protein [Stenotrophomonas sp.]|uniref:hypothetical protein n=1 Tax=Stenotrophomonas sp. TaxID=69392 RepID=UPI0028A6CE21|nr:hypothetical protein [Stenotrophomonas sp.]
MFLHGKPLLISLLLHLLVGALYWTLMPLGMTWYGNHVGFSSHGNIGLGLAQYYAFVLFLGAQPLVAILRPLAAKLMVLAIPLAFAGWTLMHNNPLRMLYFTVGPGVLALAAITASARFAARATACSTSKEPMHD